MTIYSPAHCRLFAILAFGIILISCSSSDSGIEPSASVDPSVETTDFDIDWPLIDPAQPRPADSTPLLRGQLRVQQQTAESGEPRLIVDVTLTRPTGEADRERWNSSVEYLQYAWMKRVRVWDADDEWLYPNLPFLFRLHGMDRVHRYGGWDKGHAVDNDFGAVLIRKFDAGGLREDPTTASHPLVSAEWHAVGFERSYLQTVAHQARSDAFTVNLHPDDCGLFKVWLIYADFFQHAKPASWPKEPEFDGGALAFFHVAWQASSAGELKLDITQQCPEPTGFDWQSWSGRDSEDSQAVGEARIEERLN